MKVKVRLFSIAKDICGFDERSFELSEGSSAGVVFDLLGEDQPKILQWKKSIRLAVNCEYVNDDHFLSEGDEVALIPPVSGG